MSARPEMISTGVYRVDAIRFPNAINILLLENDDGWTLVDTGVEATPDRVREALQALGSGPEDIRRIFLSHPHGDHIGGLKGIRDLAPDAEIGATEYEAYVISGKLPPALPTNPIVRRLATGQSTPSSPVGKILREGDLVSGFRLVSTPGHSLGHASLLRDADGLLFTADTFGCLPRKIRVGVRKALSTDPPMARRSARKLLGERFATVVMGHGPVLRSDARARLQRAVERCRY
jgi:glyoxylase-like metal-dependent hydrolase (beta-lactamase superfamily II)